MAGVAVNAFNPRGPCDASGCQGSGTPSPSPRPILYGDFITWTTAPDWSKAGTVGSASDITGGTVNTIEISGYYTVAGQKIEGVAQVATTPGRATYPPQGRWQIVPKNSALMGRPIRYGDTKNTFYLKYASGEGYSGRYFTIFGGDTWPWTSATPPYLSQKYDVKAEMNFALEHPNTPFNTNTLSLTERNANGNPVLYGDVLTLEIRNEDLGKWAFGTVLYALRSVSKKGDSINGMGEHTCHNVPCFRSPPCFGPIWNVYPFQKSTFKPFGDKKGAGCTTDSWDSDRFTYNFMAWPDGTIGYAHVMEPDSCKCNCGTGKNTWRFCPETGNFPRCTKNTKTDKYEWEACKKVLLCSSGQEGVNVCGDLSSIQTGSIPPDTVFCCDPADQKWKARSRSVPAGVAYACPIQTADQQADYDRAIAGVVNACPSKNRWQCAPPEKTPKPKTKPLVDTPKRRMMREAADLKAKTPCPASYPFASKIHAGRCYKSQAGANDPFSNDPAYCVPGSKSKPCPSPSGTTPPLDVVTPLVPLGPTAAGAMNSNYSCLSEDKPIFLCDLSE